MDEAAALSIGAASGHPEGAADLSLVFGVAGHIPNVGGTVSKLALDTISAALLLFPVATDFRLVQADLPIMSAGSTDKETLGLIDQMRQGHLGLGVGVDLPLGSGHDGLGRVHVVGGRGHWCARRASWESLRVESTRCCLLGKERGPHEWRDSLNTALERGHCWERSERGCLGHLVELRVIRGLQRLEILLLGLRIAQATTTKASSGRGGERVVSRSLNGGGCSRGKGRQGK